MNNMTRPPVILRTFSVLLLLWLIVTTLEVAPFFNPVQWMSDKMYWLWWLLIMWTLLVTCMLPSAVVLIVTVALFPSRKAVLIVGFCSLWVFDRLLQDYYSVLRLTPGYALSLLYVFIYCESGRKLPT